MEGSESVLVSVMMEVVNRGGLEVAATGSVEETASGVTHQATHSHIMQ